MSTSRRNFLKAMGLTVGVGSVGAAMGGKVLAAPGQELPDECPVELHEKKQQFEMLYGNGRTPAQEMERAALEAPTVEQTHFEHPRYRPGSDTDCMIPEIWANEGLRILEESMVTGALVHRDFCPDVAQNGDVVNCRVPQALVIGRRQINDNIDFHRSDIVMRACPLDQHFYAAFTIFDQEMSMSYRDIVNIHIAPAMACMARGIDLTAYETLAKMRTNMITYGNRQGSIGPSLRDAILDVRQDLNENKCFVEGRRLVISPEVERQLLMDELFVQDHEAKQSMSRLEQNRIGRILGFDCYMDPSVRGAVGFHRTAAAMVSRPLCLPHGGLGVRSFVANYNDMALRCTMNYNMMKQGTDVTFDMLCGFSPMNEEFACRLGESDIYPRWTFNDQERDRWGSHLDMDHEAKVSVERK